MKYIWIIFMMIFSFSMLSLKQPTNGWIRKKGRSFDVYYTQTDRPYIKAYEKLIVNGIKASTAFFDTAYKNKFQVYIHPNRSSLDSTWQKNWDMPGYRSECWMVASGVASRLDIISPRLWDSVSCEHKYRGKQKTQRLITHELIHVFHGQRNASPDFSATENIDWFVEGLATYASGQCDSEQLAKVKEQIRDKTYPKTLDVFWTGKLRYGLCGSLLLYLDKKYGRAYIMRLLVFSKKTELLEALHLNEPILLAAWAKYFK